MQENDILAGILAGQRLSVVLTPNHDVLKTPMPEYDECYELPFVFSEGPEVSGATRCSHLLINKANGQVQPASFVYNTGHRHYAIQYPGAPSIAADHCAVKILSCGQYREMKFALRPAGTHLCDFPLAGEEDRQAALAAVRASIRRGEKHYVVLRLNDLRVWSCPVDITYCFEDEERIELRTESELAGVHAVSPAAFNRQLVASDPTIPERLKDPNFFFLVNLKAHYTYLRLKDDGSYFTPAAEVSEQADSFVSASLFAYP